jgi:hypothetical protein
MLSACTSGEPEDATQAAKTVTGAAGDPSMSTTDAAVPITTGDVEQRVFFNATLAKEAEAPNIKADVKKDSRGKFNMVTLDVYQPFPATLPILVRARSNQAWETTPVVCRAKVTIEGNPQALAEIQFVWGKEAKQQPHEVTADVMAALPTVPESVLVVLRADTLLLPPGTDPATVDPATATAPEASSTVLLSNPVRINFHNEPAPDTAAEAIPAPAPEAAVEPAPAPEATEPAEAPAAPAQ